MLLILSFLMLLMASSNHVFGQNNGAMLPWARPNFITAAGALAANGFVCTTTTGTTTPLATFSEQTLTTANANPITLNAAGLPVSGANEIRIFLQSDSYRIAVYAAGTGNTCNGVTVGTLIRQMDNVYDLALLMTDDFNPTILDNVVHCAQYAGATAGARMVAAIAALPATGGTVDCRGLEGAQTVSQNIFANNTRCFTLLLGAATYSASVTQAPTCSGSTGFRIIANNTTWRMTAATTAWRFGSNSAPTYSQDSILMESLRIECNSSGTIGILLQNTHFDSFNDLNINDCTTAGVIINDEEYDITFRNLHVQDSGRGVRIYNFASLGDRDKITFVNADITDNTNECMLIEAAVSVTILGGSFERCTVGIALTANNRNISIIGAHFESNTVAEIDCYKDAVGSAASCVSGMSIIGGWFNATTVVGSRAIRIRGGASITITGIFSQNHTIAGIDLDNTGLSSTVNTNIWLNSSGINDTTPIRLDDGARLRAQVIAEVRGLGATAQTVYTAAGSGGTATAWTTGADSGNGICTGAAYTIYSDTAAAYRYCIDGSGHLLPAAATNTLNLGSATRQFAAINARAWLSDGVTQANLGAEANGTMRYCSDCTIANPCAGGGTGALAKRLSGAWVCN